MKNNYTTMIEDIMSFSPNTFFKRTWKNNKKLKKGLDYSMSQITQIVATMANFRSVLISESDIDTIEVTIKINLCHK
jgi:hypothetical protein